MRRFPARGTSASATPACSRPSGATAATVRQTQYAEFLVVGGLAGLLASLGAIVVGWALSQFVFDFPYRFNVWIVPVGVVSPGMLCAFAGGWLGLRGVLRQRQRAMRCATCSDRRAANFLELT